MIDYDDPLDPTLSVALEPLTDYPPRDPQKERQGMVSFLAEARYLRETSALRQDQRRHRPPETRGKPQLHTLRLGWNRAVLQAMLTIGLLCAVLFSGGVMTALSARGSLPGDTLYPVKTALEDVRGKLSSNAADHAELHIMFARNRLDEMRSLMAHGRYADAENTAKQFGNHIRKSLLSLKLIAANDPPKARELALSITTILRDYANVMNSLRSQLSVTATPAIDPTVETLPPGAESTKFNAPRSTSNPGTIAPPQSPTHTSRPLTGTVLSPSLTPTPPPTARPPEGLDIDIHKFQTTPHIQLGKARPVEIALEVKVSSATGGQGKATVVGMQNGVEIYRQTMDLSIQIVGKPIIIHFPSYTPSVSRDIVWTVMVSDENEDKDESVETTQVTAEAAGDSSNILDLDIHLFKVTKRAKLKNGTPIEIRLDIMLSSQAGGQGMATLTGVQNGAEIYHESIEVSLQAGDKHKTYQFPSFSPAETGEITWTVSIRDGDKDDDTATESTIVE